MLNAMLNVIVTEKLYDQQYVQTFTEGLFRSSPSTSRRFTPETDGADLRHSCRHAAAPFGGAPIARAEIRHHLLGPWAISQHTHGTDNARCLIALSLICGQVGRPGTGLHPLARPETTCRARPMQG